jgi:hypothetical protein
MGVNFSFVFLLMHTHYQLSIQKVKNYNGWFFFFSAEAIFHINAHNTQIWDL